MYGWNRIRNFIKKIPTTWDETKVVDAKIGEYITIGRRKGDDWYVGTINDHSARTLSVPLNFLDNGDYTAEIYRDVEEAGSDPNQLKKETRVVTKQDLIKVKLAQGGGMVIHLKKK